ncbi:glycosyltransferase family 1 protein [Streptococcus pyogenes]|uniref:glycosyltransferase family 1 protein n=1 Tax=Streptococcus pyogenes TaxID=1314 RepID=UPI003DA03119
MDSTSVLLTRANRVSVACKEALLSLNSPRSRPRVLIFQVALAPYRVDIYNSLADSCEVKLVFVRQNLLSQKFDQNALRSRLRVPYEYLTRGFTLFRRTLRLGIAASIRQFRPDVVVTVEFSPVTLSAMVARTLGSQRFAHVIWTDDNPMSICRDNWIRRTLRPIILPHVQGVVAVSSEAADLYSTRFRADCPVTSVPILQEEGFFAEQLASAKGLARSLEQEHGLAGTSKLLYVGRLAAEKRVDRLVRAFALACREVPESRLVVVGEGPERGNLEEIARSLGVADAVLFVGRQEGLALYAWYLLGDVLSLTSEFERFGAVVNEALLAGMPVICSQEAGARGLIVPGVNGEVLDAADVNKLARAIASWLRNSVRTEEPRMRVSLMPMDYQTAVENMVTLFQRAIDYQERFK